MKILPTIYHVIQLYLSQSLYFLVKLVYLLVHHVILIPFFHPARNGSRRLQSLTAHDRANVIRRIADQLEARAGEILSVNRRDLDAARAEGVTGPLFDRLALTERKILTLGAGLRQIADASYSVVGEVKRRTRVSNTMELVQKTVPIGVLLVIFESRPDALPQVRKICL